MDSRFLDSFLTVAEVGSIAESARRLYLTAAGVAQRIRALEQEIGATLLVRVGRSVRPTATASTILAQARIIQRDIRDLKSIAASGTLTGELRLGVTPTLLSGLVPNILSQFLVAYPQIEVRIIRNNSTELYLKVLEGQIDAAVTIPPKFVLPKTCQWALLREEPYVLVVPRAMKVRPAREVLEREPFIRLDRQTFAGQTIDLYLRRVGIRLRERFEMDGPEAIAVMIDRGLGVSILPDWPPPWPEGLKLRKISFPDRKFVRRVGLIWSRASLRSGLVTAFLRQAKSSIRD
jgi:DNA-binding transcriptional LysR family regulator